MLVCTTICPSYHVSVAADLVPNIAFVAYLFCLRLVLLAISRQVEERLALLPGSSHQVTLHHCGFVICQHLIALMSLIQIIAS